MFEGIKIITMILIIAFIGYIMANFSVPLLEWLFDVKIHITGASSQVTGWYLFALSNFIATALTAMVTMGVLFLVWVGILAAGK